MTMLTCPGCGYKTIQEEYDICKICFWEYDEVQNKDIDFSGGANEESLGIHQSIVKRVLEATEKLGSPKLAGYELDTTFKFEEKE